MKKYQKKLTKKFGEQERYGIEEKRKNIKNNL